MKLFKVFWKYKILFIFVFILFFCSAYTFIPEEGGKTNIVKSQIQNVLNYIGIKASSSIEQTEGYTTVLVLGIDSRDLKFNGQEFLGKDRNTDTIMQVVYDYKNNNIFLISIPRDTGIAVSEDCVNQGYDKAINRLYKLGQDGDCSEGGVGIASKYTEEITGFHNNYYALVSFETFYQFFDVIGENYNDEKGLWIDVPENVYELYPISDTGYESFIVKKGHQFLNSEELLRYARSRQSTSDFVRARRQQVVLTAVKERLLNIGFSDPAKVKEIYDSFHENALYSKIGLDEIVGALSLIDKLKDAEIYNLVLDDEFGGLNTYIARPAYSPPNGIHTRPGYYLTPVDYNKDCCKDDNYLKVREYIDQIAHFPEVYNERARVAVYNADGSFDDLTSDVGEWLDLEPPIFDLVKSKHPFRGDLDADVVILDLSKGEFPLTLEYLLDTLNGEEVDINSVQIAPAHKEDIVILIKNIQDY